MKTRKSIALGFSSAFALMLALGGVVATASGQSASLSGTVQSGSSGLSPIAGARVTLFAAGTAYGADPAGLGAAITDSDGNFTVEYTPPATPTVLYLLAHGGNAGAGTNAALGLVGVAGPSNALPASVTINELTTVAAEWALAQFFGSTGRVIGAPASNATGFYNAVNQLQANLVDIATGAPAASFWLSYGVSKACGGASPTANCDGIERLDTLANILAACVETSGPPSSACVRLRATTASTDTLQAAHVMATNPFSNVATLFNLQSSSPPFSPRLLAAPDGWEIALNFAPAGANFNTPYGVAIDAAGNVWVTNNFGNSVTELTSSGALAGNFAPSGANFNTPYGVAIDAAGNVWVTNQNDNSVTELASSGDLVGNFNNNNTPGAKISSPRGVAIDAAGNAWVTNQINSVTELTSSGGLAGNFNNHNASGANFNYLEGVAIDSAGNVWVANNFGNSVTELTSSGALAGNFAPSGANFNTPYGVAIDAAGNVWVTNQNDNSVTELASSGDLVGNFNNNNTPGAKISSPRGVAIDAAGNAWVTNQINSVTELTSSGGLAGNFNNHNASGANFNYLEGVAIDSAGNVWVANNAGVSELQAGCSSSSCTGLYFAPAGAHFDAPRSVAIDAAGNVWVTNTDSNSMAELVGLARPVLTPLVACLRQSPPHAVCLP